MQATAALTFGCPILALKFRCVLPVYVNVFIDTFQCTEYFRVFLPQSHSPCLFRWTRRRPLEDSASWCSSHSASSRSPTSTGRPEGCALRKVGTLCASFRGAHLLLTVRSGLAYSVGTAVVPRAQFCGTAAVTHYDMTYGIEFQRQHDLTDVRFCFHHFVCKQKDQNGIH